MILVSLLIAAFWGAAHALTPGHGKALVAGYLVGTKGTPRHAVLLGATVTITHTAGVFALGLVTLALSQFIVPETLYPWLTLASGLLVVGVGAAVLRHACAPAPGAAATVTARAAITITSRTTGRHRTTTTTTADHDHDTTITTTRDDALTEPRHPRRRRSLPASCPARPRSSSSSARSRCTGSASAWR